MPDTSMLKLGRLPGQIPVGLHELGYYVGGSLPKAPPEIPLPAFANWGVLGNSEYGDCGVAGLQHGMEADATVAAEHETWPDDAQAISYYLGYTGGKDTGVVLSQYLAHVRAKGYYGHTVSAYTHFDVHDVATMQSVINEYDFAYCGIAVTQGMQEAFAAGQPWRLADLESQVLGGHCVPCIAYDESQLYLVTWGAVQAVTWPAFYYMSSEAWCVMTGELDKGDGRGVNYGALVADLDQLAA